MLSCLAYYSECCYVVGDKITCAQFISVISEGFVKRMLQLEGIILLKSVVEMAKTIKIIQEKILERGIILIDVQTEKGRNRKERE